ncbi:MAG: hypothetical protein HC805_05175 [Alkalinema sp. RL_2_19]|nr:hypothetical protein [Alkalinema sp. RL_2_19]
MVDHDRFGDHDAPLVVGAEILGEFVRKLLTQPGPKTKLKLSPNQPAFPYRTVNRQLLPVWLLFGLGIGLRFANLLGKPVWLDEASTLFHISGFVNQFTNQLLTTGLPVTAADLLQYQQPNAAHGLSAMINNIADKAPELPPLYFVLLHIWMQIFGGGIWVARSLGALISLATLPAMYWLCLELFGLPIVGWYGMALLAVSPFHLNLAQELRPYSLWTVCFLMATALFIRAQRTARWRDWLGFSAAMLAGLYTHLFMLLPWLVYGLHSWLMSQSAGCWWRWTRSLKQFVVVNGLIVAGFIPWLWLGFLMPRSGREAIYAKPYDSRFGVIKAVVQGISRFFVDFSVNETSAAWALAGYGLCTLGVLAIVSYALIDLKRHADRQSRWLLWLMAALPITLLVGSDLVLNASRASFTRYYTPSAIAIEIAIAYLIASKQTFRFQASTLWQRWERQWIALLLVGVVSCGWFVIAPTWWSKTKTEADGCIVATTTTATSPLIVTDEFFYAIVGLGPSA